MPEKQNGGDAANKLNDASNLLSANPMDLECYLRQRFTIKIPLKIMTVEDLEAAQEIIAMAYSYQTFLANMRQSAKIQKRALKRQKESSQEIEDMLTREELFNTYATNAKNAYDAVSRMITIKQQISQELKMLSLA